MHCDMLKIQDGVAIVEFASLHGCVIQVQTLQGHAQGNTAGLGGPLDLNKRLRIVHFLKLSQKRYISLEIILPCYVYNFILSANILYNYYTI